MNSKSIKTCAFLILSVLIITVIVCICAIAKNLLVGKSKAYDQYTDLLAKTYELSTKINLDSTEFTKQYTKEINSNSYIASVVIQDNKNALFAYPLSSSYISFDENNEPYIKSSSAFIKVYSSSLPIQTKTIQVVCAIYTILPSTIYSYVKISFLVILVSTLLIFLIIVISSKSTNPDIEIDTNQEDNIISQEDDIFDWDETDFDSETNEESIDSILTEDKPKPVIPEAIYSKPVEEPSIEEPIEEIETIDEVEIEESQIKSINTNEIEANTKERHSPLGDNVSDPLGLFSDVTGFGWESYLETRLDAELVRAASSELDLSLVIVKFPELNRHNHIMEDIAKELLSSFLYRDLIFEFKEDGFAGVLPSSNLENSMSICEKLYKELSEIFTAKKINQKMGFGISTRTYRLIPSQRLIQEADQAADKALQEEDIPVVAFRPNVEKYKQYLKEDSTTN